MAIDRRVALAGSGAAVLAAYAALRPGRDSRPAGRITPSGTLHRGNAGEPESLDPTLSQSAPEMFVMCDLLAGLMVYDAAGEPVPGMALRWETSPDGLTWTFHLREALWSDGAKVTADDFVFSWQRILDPKMAAGYAYFLYVLKNAEPINKGKLPTSALGVRALDERTLEMTLEHPAPYLLEMLTHMTMFPVPRHLVEAKGKDWTRPGTYVGNGAYVLTEWVPNDHITMIKNPRFYDAEQVSMERVIHYPASDYSAALRQLRAGELDVQDRLPSEEAGWIRANIPELLDPVPQLILDLAVVNLQFPPFGDIRVRRAMNLAINRKAITDKVLRYGFIPAYNIVPPGTANYPGGQTLDFRNKSYQDRLGEAQALMRASGFGPEKRVQASYLIRSTSAGAYRAVAAALQQMLAQIYIDISIVSNDLAQFYDTIQQHNFEIAQAGWVADFNDASNFLDLFRTGSGNNWGSYSNPAFDAAMDRAQADNDIATRGQKLAAAEAILLKDQAAMPLFFWLSGNLVRPYVKGWKANAVDIHPSRWISVDQKARQALFA